MIRFSPLAWKRLVVAAATVVAACAHTVALAYSSLYVIGDSLSDSGNAGLTYAGIVAALGGPVPGFGPTVPSAAYYQGRASNGPLYADVLAQKLGLENKASLAGGGNYAFGGARTDYQIYGTPFLGMLGQSAALRAQHPAIDPDALVVVFGGANNIQDLLRGARTVGSDPPSTLSETVLDIKTIIDDLYSAGARNFLVPNAPNVGLVPRVVAALPINPNVVQLATGASLQLNALLDTMLDEQIGQGRNIIKLDVFSLLQDVHGNPAAYGLTNVTTPCFTGDDIFFTDSPAPCATPDSHLFWDTIHPTAAVHRVLGEAAFAAVVPEPGTWALMLAGVSMIAGVATRRRLA